MAEMNLKIKNAPELAFPYYYFTPSPSQSQNISSPQSFSKEKETRNHVFLGPYTYQGACRWNWFQTFKSKKKA